MPPLTTAQKNTVSAALDALQHIIDCYKNLPTDKKTVPDAQFKEIERTVEAMKKLNSDGKIDFQSTGYAVLAFADRNGVHLNSNFGNDYTNNYTLPTDYNLDDCENGKFYDLWRLIEILIHENYHYERHSGPVGAFRKLGLVLGYSADREHQFRNHEHRFRPS